MNRLEELHALLADIEAQMNDTTLPHSDQQLLDQAWEAYTNEIEEIEAITDAETAEWRDAESYFDSEEDDVDSPMGPGSTTVQSGFRVRNGAVKIVTFAPPSEDELLALNAMVDDRVGCEYCAGCIYCMEPSYDGADEI